VSTQVLKPGNLLLLTLNLPDTRYSDLTTKNTFLSALLERTRALPGVSASGISSKLPLSGEGGNNLVLAEGVDLPYEERPLADIRNVSPDYLTAIGIPLRKGRVFGESDRTRQVALVSALAAERICRVRTLSASASASVALIPPSTKSWALSETSAL